MTDTSILTTSDDAVAVVTLNRPQQLNAVDEPTRLNLLAALEAAERDPKIRAVILTGAGRGFCVGQDLAAADELADCHDCVGRTYNPVVRQIAGMSKPVVAAVNGPAVGAGMGFALACDMVVMSEAAFFSCAFGKVGLIPDSGATYYLTRAIGHRRAFELAVTGRRIAAAEAVGLGLANRAVAPESLMNEAREAASQLVAMSPKALHLTKRLIRDAQEVSLEHALEAEALAQGVCGQTAEHIALRTAFVNRTG